MKKYLKLTHLETGETGVYRSQGLDKDFVTCTKWILVCPKERETLFQRELFLAFSYKPCTTEMFEVEYTDDEGLREIEFLEKI